MASRTDLVQPGRQRQRACGRHRFSGVPNELVVYEGAPHSFFDRPFDQQGEASDEAWKRVLAFVARLSASN